MAVFTVFKTETCPYCVQARGFLDALAGARPDIQVRYVDANQEPGKFRAVAQVAGRSTVPQIFVDNQYIGGWSDLARAAGNGQLDAWLEGREWSPPEKKRGWFRKAKKEQEK